MKKFLLFALCAIASVSAFAEPYSRIKCDQLSKQKKWKQWGEYCYNSELSKQSGIRHAMGVRNYIFRNRKTLKLTKADIQVCLDKFKNVVNEVALKDQVAEIYLAYDYVDEALKLRSNKDGYFNFKVYNHYRIKKQYDLAWIYGKKALLANGGFSMPVQAMNTLNNMFRYKPSTITKEQQIEFLSKLAEMYPIPGTDFNQWKSFMGFVGFKYKSLTGKELF